jgi:O-antigen/teichoic acid export membrane protein
VTLLARVRALLRLKETGNLAWLLGEYGVRFVIEFLIGAMIARRLGPTAFAPYALLFTLITLVIPFTDAGLNHLISRAVLTKENSLDRIFGTAAGLRFLTCLAGIPVLALLAYFSGHQYEDLVLFAVIAGVLNTVSCLAVLDYYFQSQLEAKRSAIARTAGIAVIAVVQGTLLLSGATGNVFLWGLCLEQPLFGIMYYVVHRATGGLRLSQWHLDIAYGVSLFSRSIRLNLAAMFSAVSFRVPAILLSRFAIAATVGLWGAASEPVELWFVLSNALAATLFPRLVASRTGGPRRFARFLRAGFGGLTACGLAIATVLVVGAPVIVTSVYGSQYEGAVRAMQIYALALPLIFFRAFMSKWLVLQEHYWLSVGSQGLGAVTAVFGGWYLIHHDPSASSAALTTVLATVASSLVALVLSRSGRQLLWSLVRGTYPDLAPEVPQAAWSHAREG